MILDKTRIRQILPQAEPLLLIDRAELSDGRFAAAEVFIDPDWPVFAGHFPAKPMLPAVYLTECMAQTADLILLTIPGNEGKLPLFLGISQMRFLRPVFPKDTLSVSAVIDCDAGGGLYDCSVSALVNGKKAASGRISLALKPL